MNALIPSPDTIPVPWGYFQFLLMLTFALHLLLMNSLVGSTGIILYAHLRGDEVHKRLASGLGKVLPTLVAYTVTLGVAPLLFVQVLYGQFFYTSSILMGDFWLVVIPIVIAVYYGVYLYGFRLHATGRAGAVVVGLALLLLLAVAFILTNNMTMMLDPSAWQAYFADPHGTLLHLADPTLAPRYLHFVLGAGAIGGLFVAVFGKIRERTDPEMGPAAVRLGLRVFLVFTFAEAVVGFWFLGSLPREVMFLFMGRSAAATVLLAAGILLTVLVLLTGHRGKVVPTVVLAVGLVYVMTFLRDFVRTGFLSPVFSPRELLVTQEYGSMVMFAVTLVVGLAVLAWMILKAKAALQAAPKG